MEDGKFLRVGILFIDDEKHVAYVDDKHIELTDKEYELLKVSERLIRELYCPATILWRQSGVRITKGESRTLDVHIKTLRQKARSSRVPY